VWELRATSQEPGARKPGAHEPIEVGKGRRRGGGRGAEGGALVAELQVVVCKRVKE
jgi:hypothetical protein